MKRKEQMSDSWGAKFFLIVAGFILFLFIFSLLLLANTSQEKNGASFEDKVEFCSNTIFNNFVNGTNWISYDGSIFMKANLSNLKIQNGIGYALWTESPDYYVSPLQFRANCTNEQDTKPFILTQENYKVGIEDVRLFDDYLYLPNAITFKNYSGVYSGRIRGQYSGYPDVDMFPFGAYFEFQVPAFMEVTCTSDSYESNQLNFIRTQPFVNTLISPGYYFRSFDVDYTGGTVMDFTKFLCNFETSNLEDTNKTLYLTIYPKNFYINKGGQLFLDAQKVSDASLEFVSPIKIKFQINTTLA